jgi:rhodanese-related sulfurtransferase
VDGGIAGWVRGGGELEALLPVAAQELAGLRDARQGRITVLDVREPSEREAGAIPGSVGIPLGQLPGRLDELDRSRTVVVHCKSGYRSSIAASLLQRSGFREVGNLTGGFDAWKAAEPERSL